MRKSEFSDEQIIAAGNELIDEGKRPTAFGIKNRIGGGNAQRIRKVWEEHLAGQTVAVSEVLSELPVDVSEKLDEVIAAFSSQIREMASQVNHVAVTTSERRVAQAVSEARERQESAEAELTEAAVAVEQLEESLDALQEEKNTLLDQLQASNQELTKANENNIALSSELATTQKDLEYEKSKSSDLAEQLGQKEEENQVQADDHKNKIKVLKSEHESVIGDLKAAHIAAVDDLKSANASAVEELKNAHGEVVSGLEEKNQALVDELSGSKKELEQLRGKFEDTNSQILALAADRDSAKDEVAKYREEALLSAQTIKDLKEEIKLLKTKSKTK